MTVTPPIPPVPVLPSSWTLTTIFTLISGLAVFILGVLTASGVVLPANVSAEVQAITGSLTSIAGALVILVNQISNHSVTRARLAAAAAGLPVAEALKL